jgi:hypothetical protein
MAAALAAARAGADVRLVEAGPQLGGTVAGALIHTLGGLYDAAGAFVNPGLAVELAEALTRADPAVRPRRIGRAWVLNVCPDVYRDVTGAWLACEPRVTVLCNAAVTHAATAGDRVAEVGVAVGGATIRLRARAVIDATGTAEVVRRIDSALLQSDPRRAAGGLIVRLRGVAAGALAFPQGLAVVRALRGAAANGALPARCAHAWVDAGVYDDEAYLKLFVPLPDDWRDPRARDELEAAARREAAAVVAFLKRLPGFDRAEAARVGALGIRDGGRVRGEYCLTAADVRAARKFADAACRCCWPIEYWDPDRGVSLEYLPDGGHYEVPLRALKVRGVRNLWAAGKCLSADSLAHASARVAGACWAMGEAAGKAAAM